MIIYLDSCLGGEGECASKCAYSTINVKEAGLQLERTSSRLINIGIQHRLYDRLIPDIEDGVREFVCMCEGCHTRYDIIGCILLSSVCLP